MDIRFRFMKFRKIAGMLSITIFIISLLSLGFRGLSFGLDFSGGTLIEVSYEKPVELQDIRDTLEGNGFADYQVSNLDTNLDVRIKVADQRGNRSVGENIFNILSGGTLIEVSYEKPVELQDIRDTLERNGFADYQVSNLDTNLDVRIKVADQSGNRSVGENIFNILNSQDVQIELKRVENSQDVQIELKRVEFVGPQVGDELRDQGGLGMLIALFMILFYVAFRFQYKFALGAVTALGHDVVIVLGIFSIFGWDFDLTVLAALLAVIGYSLNDTIVVSDRIRENFRTERILEPIDMIDLSLNQTLGRTIVTSLTTLLVLFALFIFGGELIRGFSIALILGVLIGTYSSIYVVANMLMTLTLTQEDLAIPEPEGTDFDGMP